MRSRQQMDAGQWGQLLLLGVLWGASFFFARVAVAEIAPLTLVALRVMIAATALNLWLLLWRGPAFRLALPYAGRFVVLAFLNNIIPFSLIFLGQTEVGAGLAAVLNATSPFWTVIAANVLTADEKATPAKVGGILLGIAGAAVMVGPAVVAGIGAPVWAQLCIIGAALSYAFSAIYARRFGALPSTVVATGQFTASSAVMLAVMAATGGFAGLGAAGAGAWASVAGLALVSTAAAYILYFNLIASAGATNTSLVTLVVPASAILLGVLFLGETLEPFEMAGMVLIGLGLVTIDGRVFNRIFAPPGARRAEGGKTPGE